MTRFVEAAVVVVVLDVLVLMEVDVELVLVLDIVRDAGARGTCRRRGGMMCWW
jgi:hypothetical protein